MKTLIVVVMLAACGATPKVDDTLVARNRQIDDAAEMAEARRLFVDRLDEKSLVGAIAAAQRAVGIVDDDVAAYVFLARASYFHAELLYLADPPRSAEQAAAWASGAAFAERGLRALSPEFEKRRAAGDEVDVAAADLPASAAPLLYWWGLNLIRWANAEGWTTAARVYKGVFAAMERVIVLDEGYDHAGAHRFFGGARAVAPSVAGGSLDESKKEYARALELAPDYLDNHLGHARYYARKAGDQQTYEDELRFIAGATAYGDPDVAPEQELARRKAARMPAWSK